ncbi:hypothetical protein GBA63_10325 [Rubrobacter tropicus]|uniref:Histidine kinase/HSP90-like ATPase domain-containing protein n=1 Tax=Rubrobacter tropicus TaxID=2653851 RepID=A0A6G8Q944_9ACTN|nr:ATP-binding protein [Rubrobacter tropicus]QIN83000.1 hypothetical protein GBA63_10325 [Rubrobacter tropicus]
MEGPYRDLGSGFARLTGVEGARRGPSPITHVEDALVELLRNARDAGAARVFVASTLTGRRFRTLTVIDDGTGIPDAYAPLIFEPGVTTRHLAPVPDPAARTGSHHGAGLALYHLKRAATAAEVLSPSRPTALRATFDTRTLPERTLQSASRTSRTNLLAIAESFARESANATIYYDSPASILAALLKNHIIHTEESVGRLRDRASGIGLDLSSRTVQRVLRGEVRPASELTVDEPGIRPKETRRGRGTGSGGAVLPFGEKEKAEIAAILGRAARAGYVEVDDLRVVSRPGEILLKARVYEPEEEYE